MDRGLIGQSQCTLDKFQGIWSPRWLTQKIKIGARQGIRTHTKPVLSRTPLPIGIGGHNMEERVGFEPTVRCRIIGFQDRLLKPLGHLSIMVDPLRLELRTDRL